MSTSFDNEKMAGDKYRSSHIEEVDPKLADGHLHRVHSTDPILEEFTPEEVQKIVHRVDRRLVSVVGLMYCISLMDRTNLGAAVLAGMAAELKLTVGLRYSIITLVFFTTYVVFQFPSTIVIRYLGPRIHLGSITVAWGVIMLAMGFVNDWQTLAGLRVILGILEAGFFPGAVYLLSTWYVRYETHKRYSVFYFIGSVSSALSGILAYGIMQMNGIAGKAGWRWIFIIEGIITILIGLIGFIVLVGFPDSKKRYWGFLNDRETALMLARVQADRGDAKPEPFALRRFLAPALDWKIWCYGLIFCMTTTVTYALAYFLPIILKDGMGFSTAAAQCLVAPPYLVAGFWMYGTGWFGDKYHVRGGLVVANAIIALVGVTLMGFTSNSGARYFGVFLAAAGANSNVPASMAYQANNIRGHWKRAFCSATLVGLGGVGGIAGSLIFRSQDAPKYVNGLYGCIASQLIILLIVAILTPVLLRANRRADESERSGRNDYFIDGEPGYRYTI